MARYFLPCLLFFFPIPLFLLATSQSDIFCENQYPCEYCSEFSPSTYISILPEFYYLRRDREGGTQQTGGMYGLRISFDRVKPWGVYMGLQGFYGEGTLKGHSGLGDSLKSTFQDLEVEGRGGYTLSFNVFGSPTFTPFLGYGYKEEMNQFRAPSPLELKYKTSYGYFVGGCLSTFDLTQCWRVGLNFKVRGPWEAKCKVSNDPEFSDVILNIEDKFSYRVEAPLLYRFDKMGMSYIGLSPFYEFRHYGRRANAEFDFLDTKLRLYGCNLQFVWGF